MIKQPPAIHTAEELQAYFDSLPGRQGPPVSWFSFDDGKTPGIYSVYGMSFKKAGRTPEEHAELRAHVFTSLALVVHDIVSQGSEIVWRRPLDIRDRPDRWMSTIRVGSWPPVKVRVGPEMPEGAYVEAQKERP
jgi:hypothetical protein